MKRPILLAAGAGCVVIFLALAGGYAYFFSGLRTAPKPLTLSRATPTPAAAATASAPAATSTGSVSGAWSVGSGSLARYRVKEVFASQTSNHEAVSETSSVSGSLTVQDAAGTHAVSDLKITAQLSDLHSVDTVAGFNVGQRDRIVQGALSTSSYPSATFEAANVQLPANVADGSTITLTVPGQLTIHGVTRTEQVSVQLRVSGGSAQAVGSTSFNMTDFNVQPPQVPITTVQPQVTLEFQLNLSKS